MGRHHVRLSQVLAPLCARLTLAGERVHVLVELQCAFNALWCACKRHASARGHA